MTTSDIWATWSSCICQALSSGLKELAKDVDFVLPDTKDFLAHGKVSTKEVPLFAKSHLAVTNSTTTITNGYALQIGILKQIRRLQTIITLHKK
eukprot:337656-Karenia_brevis.AAC.1